jgi:hypothetical protein
MVRSGAVVMRMVSSEAPTTDLPQRAVVLVVVGRVLIAFEAVREGGGRPRPLTFLTRKEAKVPLWNFPTLKTVAAVFINPL